MADIEPIAKGVSGYLNSRYDVFLSDPVSSDPNSSGKYQHLAGAQILSYYFADIDTTETFAAPSGTLAVALQANTTTDKVVATIESGGITFTGASNASGWLHCLRRGTLRVGSTTSEAPAARSASGYVNPYRTIFQNHKSATPNTLTNAKRAVKQGLRMQVIPFAPTNNGDRWKATTGTLSKVPGIVAIAWQGNLATDDVAATLDASGDVIFTSTAGAVDVGWLWVWSN